MKRKHLSLAIGCALLSPEVWAQDTTGAPLATPPAQSSSEATSLDAIVVTARRRSEWLQDVPVAVTAFDESALQARQVTNVVDIMSTVPNLHVSNNIGQGSATTEVLFLGGGPGDEEDASGRAFVGPAGLLLTKMIDAMGFSRDTVYICNIVKCRPPENRRPEPSEIEQCQPFAERQIRAIKPKIIVALGETAAQSLLRSRIGITLLRNTWQSWEGIPVMPTFHPSYVLLKPDQKGKVWDDLKLVVAKLGRELPKKKGNS